MEMLKELEKDFEKFKKVAKALRENKDIEKLFFDRYNRFWSWVHAENVEVLWSVTGTEKDDDIIHYYVLNKGIPKVAVVRLTVDDFYIPKELAEAKLTEDYVLEKAENYDWTKPAVICAELYDLFHKIIDVSARAGFSTLSPEEAKKLLDMADYVAKAGNLLKKMIWKGVKDYVARVALGFIRDDRWTEERVKRVFGCSDADRSNEK
ncbi:hypothetical protein DRP04_10655 [Archaeoglobales archaeon]|nr:MAG: hypothetical protein DRP04_10655 [Archaeoglobales archaeon]